MEDEKFVLDRTFYKKVKAMNRDSMEQTFQNIFQLGFDAAVKEKEEVTVNLDNLRADLKEIKGVGDTRLNEIMAIIEKHLQVIE